MSLSALLKISELNSSTALKHLSVSYLRKMLDEFAGLLNERLPKVGAFHENIPYRSVDGVELTLDVTVPLGSGPFPVMVYIHGGAWIWGSPVTHRKLTHRLAQQGFLTLSVDYRLAPEAPFPAGLNDCIHAVHFAAEFASKWGGDSDRIVIAGDSAGANLAAATAIELASSIGTPDIRGVGLLYGVYDFRSGEAPDPVTTLLYDAYLGDLSHLVEDPRVSPVMKVASLPPAFIAVGTEDELIEDAENLTAEMTAVGKPYNYKIYPGMPHAFSQMEFLPFAKTSISDMADYLHKILKTV